MRVSCWVMVNCERLDSPLYAHGLKNLAIADGVLISSMVDGPLEGASVFLEPLGLAFPSLASSGCVCRHRDPCNLSVVPSGGRRERLWL